MIHRLRIWFYEKISKIKMLEKKNVQEAVSTQIYQIQLCLLIIVIVIDSNIKTYTVDITG